MFKLFWTLTFNNDMCSAGYNDMKGALKEYLKSFADNGKVGKPVFDRVHPNCA